MASKLTSYLLGLTILAFIDHGRTLEIEAIRGGQAAHHCQYPYHVSLQDAGGSFCGGAIVGERYVATAAHCVVTDTCSVDLEDVSVIAGAYNLHDLHRTQTAKVERVFLYPRYDPISLENDVAVLKLKEPLRIRLFFCTSVLQLPVGYNQFSGDLATLTGFGQQKGHNGKAGVLRHLSARILSNEQCKQEYSLKEGNRQLLDVQPSMMCAMAEEPDCAGQCDGDNGSPLVANIRGEATLLGIASRNREDCNETKGPSIYTRVSFFSSFIRLVLNNDGYFKGKAHGYYTTIPVPEDKDAGPVKFFIGEPSTECRKRSAHVN